MESYSASIMHVALQNEEIINNDQMVAGPAIANDVRTEAHIMSEVKYFWCN